MNNGLADAPEEEYFSLVGIFTVDFHVPNGYFVAILRPCFTVIV